MNNQRFVKLMMSDVGVGMEIKLTIFPRIQILGTLSEMMAVWRTRLRAN